MVYKTIQYSRNKNLINKHRRLKFKGKIKTLAKTSTFYEVYTYTSTRYARSKNQKTFSANEL